jgi:predicted metal-dependent hydrolase
MAQSSRIRRPAGVVVTSRRMKFDFEERGFARDWLGGSLFKSMFWSQLSTAFAKGEGFFVASARGVRDRIDDPRLRSELDEFCRQEGHHTAQHLKFDRINTQLGVDVAACRAHHERNIDLAIAQTDPLVRLAVTAALEHLTACLAQQLLSNPNVMKGADPNVSALWLWHAAEELEHSATCFDLYEQAGGTYEMRVRALLLTWPAIVWTSLKNTLYLVAREGQLYSMDTLRGLSYLFGPKGVVTGLLPAFLAYCRSSYHPWKHADGTEIAQWEAKNRRFIARDSSKANAALATAEGESSVSVAHRGGAAHEPWAEDA